MRAGNFPPAFSIWNIINNMSSQVNQTIEALLNHSNNKLETSKTSNVFSQGAVQASKEIVASFAEHIIKRRDEYANLVKQEKMTAEAANFALTQLRSVSLFLEEKFRDCEKISYVKQGELISINSQVNELQTLLRETNQQHVQVTPEPIPVEAAPVSIEQKEENSVVEPVIVKKRPDEMDTRIGKAAKDIKNRRKEAQALSSQVQTEIKRPGRPKK